MDLKARWAERHPRCHRFPAGSCPAPPVPTPPIQLRAHPRKGKSHIVQSTFVKTALEENAAAHSNVIHLNKMRFTCSKNWESASICTVLVPVELKI